MNCRKIYVDIFALISISLLIFFHFEVFAFLYFDELEIIKSELSGGTDLVVEKLHDLAELVAVQDALRLGIHCEGRRRI